MRRRTPRTTSRRSIKPAFERVEARMLLATFTVSNTTDNTSAGSLRYAITQSNATPGLNSIEFDIAASGVQTIALTSALPTITVPVLINGNSEPGYAGKPLVELDGAGAGKSVDGLDVAAGGTTIKGLAINRFTGDGINISAAGNDTISADFLGTDPTGTIAEGNGVDGLFIGANANSNTISGNLMSGNTNNGIHLDGSTFGFTTTYTTGNLITGNLIGTDVTGSTALTNGQDGVYLQNGEQTTIGGTTPAARNIISGNGCGLELYDYSDGTVVEGNFIGTNIAGTAAIGNAGNGSGGSHDGIEFRGISNSTIGGTTPGAGNLISGNTDGIGCFVIGSENLAIEGNLIGTDVTDTKPLGNTRYGVDIWGPSNVTLGGTTPGAGNVISGNGDDGIDTFATGPGFMIEGNEIGTDATGTISLGNGGDGVHITFPDATVGGIAAGAGNIIANNGFTDAFDHSGVEIDSTTGIPVLSNSIYKNKQNGIYPNDGTTAPAPVLTSAETTANSSAIVGTLTATAGTYTVQFFATSGLDAAGNAEGETLLGSQSVTVSGSSASLTLSLPYALTAGEVISADATGPAGTTSNFSSGITVQQMPIAPTIGVTASVASLHVGQQVTDTFTITNPASVAADAGVSFADTIPAGTTFVSGTTSTGATVLLSNGMATANFGALAAGQSVTVAITLKATTVQASFTNTGGVTATTPVITSGTVTASTTTTIVVSADQSVSITAPSPNTSSGRLTFVALVTNSGLDAATGSMLTDTLSLPTGATIASETVSVGTVSVSGNVVTASFGTLANGATATLTVIVIAKGDATFGDSAVVSASTTDPNSANNSASVSVNVRGVAAVSLIPSVTKSTPEHAFSVSAQVSVPPGFPSATKTVTFYDATTPLGTATLNAAGVATLAVTLNAVGIHNLVAVYSGDTNYAGLVSTAAPVKIADAVPDDFDGDSKSDVAIYDQTSATFAINNSGGGSRIALLGNAHDVNIPDYGDFDGDGKTDLAVYDQTTATFDVIDSSTGALVVLPFGNPLDKNVPVAGDFNGAGKTNYAIFDQTTATFYVLESGKVVSQQLGSPRDVNVPDPGDFDGDGKTDFAVYDQTQATFLILDSGGGSRVQQLGNSHDVNIPIAGDYDGDGKTDLAIFDQTHSTFLILESGGGTIAEQFGIPGDVNVPVLGDFGDEGRADIAIFDTTTATFLVQEWNGGSIVEKYGNPQDKNVPD